MISKVVEKRSKSSFARTPLFYLAILITLVGLAALACGVESGNRRAARPTQTAEFHRSPVAAFEQFRVNVDNSESGCSADPADISGSVGQRIRLAIQLTAEGVTGGSGGSSTQFTGERDQVKYLIQGLQISGSGGAFTAGVTDVDLELDSGTRRSYDFNIANAGTFDILCDGVKIGTFTANEG